EVELVAGEGRAPADAVDLEDLLVALGDAVDHVGDVGAGGAPERADGAVVVVLLVDGDGDRAPVDDDGDLGAVHHLELLAGRLDDDLAVRADLDGHPGGDGDGLLADAAHGELLTILTVWRVRCRSVLTVRGVRRRRRGPRCRRASRGTCGRRARPGRCSRCRCRAPGGAWGGRRRRGRRDGRAWTHG